MTLLPSGVRFEVYVIGHFNAQRLKQNLSAQRRFAFDSGLPPDPGGSILDSLNLPIKLAAGTLLLLGLSGCAQYFAWNEPLPLGKAETFGPYAGPQWPAWPHEEISCRDLRLPGAATQCSTLKH